MGHRLYGFVDGENLVLRYEDMIRSGAIPKPGVVHIPGVLVWHPDITMLYLCEVARVSFYQTVVGAQDKIDAIREQVCATRYSYSSSGIGAGVAGNGSLYPRLFKKQKKETKTKSVDINISVDILRTVMNRNADGVLLLSGDGDYLPLVEEVARHGQQVWLGAFSSGLSRDLRYAADDFIDLDSIFFEQANPAP